MKKQLEPTLKDFLSICSPCILKQWKLHLASAVNHNMSELGVKTSVSFQGAQVVGSTIALLSMNWWIEQALEEKEEETPTIATLSMNIPRDEIQEPEKPKPKKPKQPKVKQGQLSKEEHKARMAEVLEMNKANKKVENA